jgi:hypothetical protein
MEEDEYKSTYGELASVRCVFEKALTNNQLKCPLANHFCLADREGYSCDNKESSKNCDKLLQKLRKKSAFVLKLRDIDSPLPHNMEIRVQVGGIAGLARLINTDGEAQVKPLLEDIDGIIKKLVNQFGSLDDLPYSEVIQSVVKFQGRRRRQR